ncbi:hypothetical protein AB0H83_35820 [Dactylosporangium sp. NPDC050688]|uniref:hypothetical protein n=1 Tax=Dactylosporangium sp. NPDC050688 TaxID=3157217 RepID=UPI0033F24D91
MAMTGPIGVPQRRWMGVLGSRGPLAAFSALEVLGLKGYAKSYTEVLITAERRVRAALPETVIRRTATLPREDVLQRLPPSTVAARSLVDAAQWARDDAEATAVVAAAFQQRLVSGDEVLGVLGRLRGVRREALIQQAGPPAAGRPARGGLASLLTLDTCAGSDRSKCPRSTRRAEKGAAGRRPLSDGQDWNRLRGSVTSTPCSLSRSTRPDGEAS